jgi:hypothetical protein
MSTGSKTATDGRTAATAGPRAPSAREVAQRGISDVSDVGVLAGAIMTDALLGNVGFREGTLAVRGGNLVLRSCDHMARNGNTALVPAGKAVREQDTLAREEEELTARLEAVRERRAAEAVV